LARATAIVLAREGARVIVVDRRLDSAQETVNMILAEGGQAWPFETDVTDEDAHHAADQSEAIKALEARLESLVVDVTPRGGGR
jgi:NAD(P)-dependent dehydrogenase (short-subunit alcohol dehydrogenase family)